MTGHPARSRPIVIGLTGSIGMGKSSTARMFRRLGVPVYEADAAIHRLLAPGGRGVLPVRAAFPEADDGRGGIDRRRLGARVFDDPAALARLEDILHPLARTIEADFFARCRRQRRRLVVLDIPLLFETGGERRVDLTVVVTAPAFLQRQRVLARPGMTAEKFDRIRARQMSDGEKRARADVIIHTGLGFGHTARQVKRLVRALTYRDRQTAEGPCAK